MITMINLCVYGVPPAPVYKGAREEGGRPMFGRAKGSPTPTGSRIPPFLVQLGVLPCRGSRREGKGREKEKEGRGRPPSLVQFGLEQGEGRGHLLALSLLFPYGPMRPNTNSRNSPVLRKILESLGTFPNSEYGRPIYRSLRLDHVETPRHVLDLIRDSELLRYIKTHNNCHRNLKRADPTVREQCRHDRDTSPVNNQ